MTRRTLRLATGLAGAILIAALAQAPARAADSGNTDSTSNPPVDCVKEKGEGWVYSEEEKKCVQQQTLNDEQLFQQGNALAVAGHYESALDVLGAVRNKQDADVLTMIGYATRKLGNTDEGIAIYHQALAIDPDNLNTREYLGEGYVAQGRIDLAEVQLDTLGRLCGADCEQYRDLEAAISGAPGWN